MTRQTTRATFLRLRSRRSRSSLYLFTGHHLSQDRSQPPRPPGALNRSCSILSGTHEDRMARRTTGKESR